MEATTPRKRLKRIERDGQTWIARRKDGSAIFDENWRWNSRATARQVIYEADCIEAEGDARR